MKLERPKVIGGAIGILLFLLIKFVPSVSELLGELYRRPYLMFIAVGALALFYLPRYRKSARLNDEGVKLLSEGYAFAALEKFTAARALAQSPVVTTYNIGICRLCLWQLDEAERELSSVNERKDLTPQFRGILMAPLALVAALDGRLSDALKRLDEAKELKNDSSAQTVLASAVFACRKGHWAEGKALLERPECLTLVGSLRGLRDALLAWNVKQLTGEHRRVEPIAVFGEASPDKLQAAWPELVAFILAGHQELKAKSG